MALKFHQGKSLFFTQTDEHIIEVRQNRRYRWMHFGGPSIQSAMSLSNPTALVLPYMRPMVSGMIHLKPDPKSICMLGLGGGSFVRYFHQRYPQTPMTVVELDPVVMTIAEQFFELPAPSESYQLLQGDAFEFLDITPERYDVIFSDIYSHETLPEILNQIEFYQRCADRLLENGLLVANLITETMDDFIEIIHKIRHVFANHTLCLPIPKYRNIIVYASNNPNFNQVINQLVDAKILNGATLDSDCGLCAKSISLLD